MTAESDIPMFNDAEVYGVETPAYNELLDKKAVLMSGELYDQGDRRNTKDGDWKRIEATWFEWVDGLTKHPVGKTKQGKSLVFAEAIDGARKDSAIKTMHAVGIDIDSGASLDDVMRTLIDLEIFAIVYTSFSHGKSRIDLKHDDIVRKLKLDDTPNRAQVQAYLREHHKDRYDPDFIDSIKIIDARHQTKDGLRVIIETPPLDKFRVVLPLAEPVELADLGNTLAKWKEAWENAVCGVAVNMLGVNFDASSCDVNRLFYTPRHPSDAEDWYCAVVQGDPLRFDEIEPYSKNAYAKNRDDNDPFAKGTGADKDEIENFMAPSGQSLNRWHKDHKDRFLITDVIETFCDDKIRKAGNERVGTVHIECPFEHEHSTTGGTATMCMNPTENSEGYWTVFCRHDACSGRNKLHFLQEMLEQNWFDEALLHDDQFNLGAADEDTEEEEVEEDAVPEGPGAEAAKFTRSTPDADIVKFMRKQLKLGIGVGETVDVNDGLQKSMGIGKRAIDKLWAQAKKEHRQTQEKEDAPKHPVVNEWGFDEMLEYAEKRIHAASEKNPQVFQYMEVLARIEDNAESIPRIVILDDLKFRTEINKITTWFRAKPVGDGGVQHIKVPMDREVANFLFGDRYSGYPNLLGLTKTPVFSRDGELVSVPGYHAKSGLYYQPDNSLDIPQVSKVPTDDEVYEAKRLFIEEVFGDFPLGGLKREQIVEMGLDGDGVPAVTHLIGMVLLMFCRDMVRGPTPGHLLTKPSPGTGASLLTDVCSIIANGEVTAAMTIPSSDEEMNKTLVATMADGSNIVYFDNIDKDVNSGGLASAMTAPKVKGRMLGHSKNLEAEVRCIWILCGNNVRLSDELIRRLVMVDLDAQMAHPEERSGWRHKDIGAWVLENRGRLVWAALTLIQNWIAMGKPSYDGKLLNSFENWSRVIGGICEAAGLGGFLGNRDALKDRASDSSGSDISLFLEAWWETFIDKPVYMRNTEDDAKSLIGMAIAQDLQMPIRFKQNADGDKTYDQTLFEGFLMLHHMRVYELNDGTQVSVRKAGSDKKGTLWKLEVVKNG